MEKEGILEFGIKRENEERRDGGCCVVFDPNTKKYAVYKHPKSDVFCLFGGGFDEGEDEQKGCLRELVEESGLVDYSYTEKLDSVITHYFNNNKMVNRIAYATCYLVVLNSLKKEDTKLENHESDFKFILATSDEILNNWNFNNNSKDYEHWIYFLKKAVQRLEKLGHLKTSF